MNRTELVERMKALPPIEGDTFWAGRRRDLRGEIESGRDPGRFLSWAVIKATMFVGTGAGHTKAELKYLNSHQDWRRRWQFAIEEHPFGNPDTMRYTLSHTHGMFSILRTSGNMISQAYSLARWEEATGLGIDDMRLIVEVGGGYGAMCRLVHKLGFAGVYVLYDLPEFLLLQEYYLTNVDLPAGCDIVYTSDLDWAGDFAYDLLIANYSLSEMDGKERIRVLRDLDADHYLIRYMDVNWRDGTPNRTWFLDWALEEIGEDFTRDVHLYDEHWMVAS